MKRNLILSLALASAFIPSIASSFRLPEIDFCPLGGPPGWFNRMTGQNDHRYYGPPPMLRPLYPPAAPYALQSPIRQPPVYFPSNQPAPW